MAPYEVEGSCYQAPTVIHIFKWVMDKFFRIENSIIRDCFSYVHILDGGWSDWLYKRCDGFVKTMVRHCDNPTPKNGGRLCQGGDGRIQKQRTCNGKKD